MQKDDRYIPYNLQVTGDHIVFSSLDKKTQSSHLLSEAHIHSVDDRADKTLDKKGKFSGVIMTFSNETYRKVFFFSHT